MNFKHFRLNCNMRFFWCENFGVRQVVKKNHNRVGGGGGLHQPYPTLLCSLSHVLFTTAVGCQARPAVCQVTRSPEQEAKDTSCCKA